MKNNEANAYGMKNRKRRKYQKRIENECEQGMKEREEEVGKKQKDKEEGEKKKNSEGCKKGGVNEKVRKKEKR